MSKKKYISTGASPLSIDLLVGGSLRSIDFIGGMKSPVVKLPTYSTSDEEEQKAIEAYPGFNVSFKLVEVPFVPAPEIEKETIEVELKETAGVKKFKSYKEAKEWINTNHKVSFSKLTNKEHVIHEFKKLGFEIEVEQ